MSAGRQLFRNRLGGRFIGGRNEYEDLSDRSGLGVSSQWPCAVSTASLTCMD